MSTNHQQYKGCIARKRTWIFSQSNLITYFCPERKTWDVLQNRYIDYLFYIYFQRKIPKHVYCKLLWQQRNKQSSPYSIKQWMFHWNRRKRMTDYVTRMRQIIIKIWAISQPLFCGYWSSDSHLPPSNATTRKISWALAEVTSRPSSQSINCRLLRNVGPEHLIMMKTLSTNLSLHESICDV